MGANLRCGHVSVAEQILHRADVIAVFQKMRGERMAQRVARCRFRQSRQLHRRLHHPLHARLVQMIPLPLPVRRIGGNLCPRPEPLPNPFPFRLGIKAFCKLDEPTRDLLKHAMTEYNLSARA